ncbi:DUF3291 domain-containing protein [Chitinophaga sp. RAB17]|uniref:DUF3291 domain-containing protein n=1 Tax=Chitinophaga sp. RAB17 TaxID=3233049 RepID=UPI003F9294C4
MTYHIAQINIGRVLAPMDSPVMSTFVERLDDINALADNSEGFVWRLKDDNNNASSIRVFEDDTLIVNMSVWKDIDTLYAYTYQTAHTEILKRRKEWFEKMGEMQLALWYVPQGHVPTVAEAEERLTYLRENGPTPYAFTFKQRFSYEEAMTFTNENTRV